MAQVFYDPGDLPVGSDIGDAIFVEGTDPSNGNTVTAEIVAGDGQNVLKIARDGTFGSAAVFFDNILPTSLGSGPVEVFVRFKTSHADYPRGKVIVNPGAAETWIDGDAYSAGFHWDDFARILKRSPYTALAATGNRYTGSDFQNIVYGIEGSTHELYAWIGDIASKPTTPTLSTTDQEFDISAWDGIGFYHLGGGDNLQRNKDIYFVGIGTDGDPAPTEPVAGGELVSLTSIDTIWTEDIADPKVSIGSSVSEVTATDDSPPGAALDLLALLYDNGVLSDEELAKLKALGTTEDQILLSDNAELFFRLQRFLEDRAEFDDGAEMILSAIASARDGVTFGGVFVPSIADIIIAVVQSTMMVGTTTKATADALDMVTDSVSLNDTFVAEVLRLAGDVILENTAFSSQVASKLVALVRTTTNLAMSELIESNVKLRMKIYENVGLNDGAFSRLTDILWLAAEISIRLKTIGDVSINPDE